MSQYTPYDGGLMMDPTYQSTLFMLEEALREVGAMPKPANTQPDVYDEWLMELIDAVPME